MKRPLSPFDTAILFIGPALAAIATFSQPAFSPASATEFKDVPAMISTDRPATPAEALDVIAFWREAGPKKWFAKDAAFDVTFRDRFAALYSQASRGELVRWRSTAEGALAEILLLDQYPRNSFRGTPWMYATDALAREATYAAIAAGQDKQIDKGLRVFVYLPLGHSENLADQDKCVELNRDISERDYAHAKEHREIIAAFGRFPHRNPVLGRIMTGEEAEYLQNGGYQG